jgi:hypothetical protein
MPTLVTMLIGALSSLAGKILPSVLTGSARAEELKAEKDLVEAKAFAKGRISPKYLYGFLAVAVFAACAILGIVAAIFPGAVSLPFKNELIGVIKSGREFFGE